MNNFTAKYIQRRNVVGRRSPLLVGGARERSFAERDAAVLPTLSRAAPSGVRGVFAVPRRFAALDVGPLVAGAGVLFADTATAALGCAVVVREIAAEERGVCASDDAVVDA